MAISLLPYGICRGVSDIESDCTNCDGEGSTLRLPVRCFFGGLVGLAVSAASFSIALCARRRLRISARPDLGVVGDVRAFSRRRGPSVPLETSVRRILPDGRANWLADRALARPAHGLQISSSLMTL